MGPGIDSQMAHFFVSYLTVLSVGTPFFTTLTPSRRETQAPLKPRSGNEEHEKKNPWRWKPACWKEVWAHEAAQLWSYTDATNRSSTELPGRGHEAIEDFTVTDKALKLQDFTATGIALKLQECRHKDCVKHGAVYEKQETYTEQDRHHCPLQDRSSEMFLNYRTFYSSAVSLPCVSSCAGSQFLYCAFGWNLRMRLLKLCLWV